MCHVFKVKTDRKSKIFQQDTSEKRCLHFVDIKIARNKRKVGREKVFICLMTSRRFANFKRVFFLRNEYKFRLNGTEQSP